MNEPESFPILLESFWAKLPARLSGIAIECYRMNISWREGAKEAEKSFIRREIHIWGASSINHQAHLQPLLSFRKVDDLISRDLSFFLSLSPPFDIISPIKCRNFSFDSQYSKSFGWEISISFVKNSCGARVLCSLRKVSNWKRCSEQLQHGLRGAFNYMKKQFTFPTRITWN